MSVKLNAAIGFCMKAGKLVSGDFAASKAVSTQKAHLVLIDTKACEATKKHWRDSCTHYNLRYIEVCDVGHAIGKEERMIIAVTDIGFASMINNAYIAQFGEAGGQCQNKTGSEVVTDAE